MPLLKGMGAPILGENVRELVRGGHRQDAAIAIAMQAGKKRKRKAPMLNKPVKMPGLKPLPPDDEFDE